MTPKNSSFDFSFNDEGVTLCVNQETPGFLIRILGKQKKIDIDQLSTKDRHILFAIADLKHVAERHAGELITDEDSIWISHNVLAALDAQTATSLGLPPLVDLIFKTDIEGVPGQDQFRLQYEWLRLGEKQVVIRVGAILKTSEGIRRLPTWLLEAIKVAENLQTGSDFQAHWEAMAKFRQALEPDSHEKTHSTEAVLEMSNFLRDLNVQIADSFSISPTGSDLDPEFEVVPFSQKSIEEEFESQGTGEISVGMSELAGRPLKEFQKRVRSKGAQSAYKVGDKRFLVVDQAAMPALRVMADMHHAPISVRRAFINNPRQKITEAIENDLRKRGLFDGLTDAQKEELIEQVAFPTFIETREYSERVTGKALYKVPNISMQDGSATTWLPEVFGDSVARLIGGLPLEDLETIEDKIREAISEGRDSIQFSGEHIPATPATERAIRRQIQEREYEEGKSIADEKENDTPAIIKNPKTEGPIILEVKDNLEQVHWRAKIEPRHALIPTVIPKNVTTTLKSHQVESLNWQVNAWKSGLPGILNADEQGLGKTLQTIAFLSWLKAQMAQAGSRQKGPILIVAPTSLLVNWEQEVEHHLSTGGLGHLVRLYGSGISTHQKSNINGTETKDGEERLDLNFLHQAISDGTGHQYWLLTTYTTLTNYQHSLGTIPFSALVFDEIQALKNPVSLRAKAGMAMKADFRIGLTGTPIENSTTDLWAIVEQLVSGRLLPLTEFRKIYNTPEEENLRKLYEFIFEERDGLPPTALRRLKADVAQDLPAKIRALYPRLMSETQGEVYERARDKLASGKKGAALKMLHHIRSVSVHPAITAVEESDDFIALSGRLKACFEIIDEIYSRGERVLVFIEHIQMQYRFIELLKLRFTLKSIDLINGSTPIHKRQEIVNRFQRHLIQDEGFDILVLGPKAAGTGLTLTAATHVIHLSRWWNPAVEEQCNDRVHRIGQNKEVTIHIPMSIHKDFREHSFDCLLHSLMNRKRRLASTALWPMGDTDDDADQLQKLLSEASDATPSSDSLHTAIIKTFERDQRPIPERYANNSYRYE